MNIVRNDKVIKRNSRIAQFTMFGGLIVLGGGMFVSFRYPEQYGLSLAALMLGFLLSQVGIYFSNRFGRSPRPDEKLDAALKGLDGKYSLYHYTTPVSHLMVGPSGVWILLPYYQRGVITFAKNRWRQKGGNAYLKIFAQESLGRPEIEVSSEQESLKAYFKKILPEGIDPEINTALVFTNPKAEVEIPESETPPAETVTIGKLKELMRKGGRGKSLSVEKVKVIQDAISLKSA